MTPLDRALCEHNYVALQPVEPGQVWCDCVCNLCGSVIRVQLAPPVHCLQCGSADVHAQLHSAEVGQPPRMHLRCNKCRILIGCDVMAVLAKQG
jgi:hypothetical protein